MGGWSTSANSTSAVTLSSSRAAATKALTIPSEPNAPPASRRGPRTLFTYNLVFAALNVPQSGPGYLVPDGCRVRVRAYNGAAGGNSGAVFASDSYSSLISGHGVPLAPLDDVEFSVKNLASVWAKGAAGDGIVISVVGGQ